MLRPPFAALLICAAILAASPLARAQDSSPAVPNNEFGVWGGYSVNNPHLIGITGDRQLGILAVRYGRRLASWRHVVLEYTVDVMPVEILRQASFPNCAPLSGGAIPSDCGHETVYGGGANPIGFKLNFRPQRRLQIFGASTTGFVVSLRPIPTDSPAEEQFNFTFDFQLGLQRFNADRSRAWMFGYRYQHISNAYRGQINPGVDANVLFVGYSFFR